MATTKIGCASLNDDQARKHCWQCQYADDCSFAKKQVAKVPAKKHKTGCAVKDGDLDVDQAREACERCIHAADNCYFDRGTVYSRRGDY